MKIKDLIEYGLTNDDATLEILEGMTKIIDGYYDIWNWCDDDSEKLQQIVANDIWTKEAIEKFYKKYKICFNSLISDLEQVRKAIIIQLIQEKGFIKLYKHFMDQEGFTIKHQSEDYAKTFIKQMKTFIKEKGLTEEFHKKSKNNEFMQKHFDSFDYDFENELRKHRMDDEIC